MTISVGRTLHIVGVEVSVHSLRPPHCFKYYQPSKCGSMVYPVPTIKFMHLIVFQGGCRTEGIKKLYEYR